MSSQSNDYFFFDRLTFDDVRALVSQPMGLITRPDYRLQIHHTRLQTFTKYGCRCRGCKRKADRFHAECHVGPSLLKWYFNPLDNPVPIAHINLYGTDHRSGGRFMMTSDHVAPRSLGGSDGIDNRVPLCETCNNKKGNDPDWLVDLPRNKHGTLIHRANRQTVGKPQNRRERYYA